MIQDKETPFIKQLIQDHPRLWQDFKYVYPVISRRSEGLSIGINMNPDCLCNFDCVYCCVRKPSETAKALTNIEPVIHELREMLHIAEKRSFWEASPFNHTPYGWRQIKDIAFSGNGEPTACPLFPRMLAETRHLLDEMGYEGLKIVLITNASLLHQERTLSCINAIDPSLLDVWCKFDAGTAEEYKEFNRSPVKYEQIVNNIVSLGQLRPITLQTMVMKYNHRLMKQKSIEAYIQQVHQMRQSGMDLQHIQLYTVARRTREANVKPLTQHELNAHATLIREAFPDVKISSYS